MITRIVGVLVLSLLVGAAVACGETTPSPTPIPSQAVVEPTPPPTVAASGVVTGTVTYRERVALTPDAVVEVKLLDVSRADAPAETIGEKIIENPGQVPIAFEIEYDPADIESRFSYAVRAVIKEGDRLAFTTDTRYSVITRDNPTHVDLILVRVAATPTEPTTATTATVTGTVTYRERIALAPDAVVEVKLSDVSQADAPAVTIGEQIIENPGQVPIAFEIEYDQEDIDERFTYAIQVRIMEGDRLAFINDTSYQVITRDNPTHVDIVLVKVGATPTEPSAPAMISVPAPVQSVKVNASDSEPPEYSLMVLSTLPLGTSCSAFEGYQVTRVATTVSVTVTNVEVAPGQVVPCTADFGYTETEISLGSDLTAGESYTVVVNEEVTNSFLARDERTSDWVVMTSPIETVAVVVSDPEPKQYSLSVVSRLPRGSSCSAFNGYDVASRFAGRIEVTVTHLEVAPGAVVPCTADLPVVSTEISLGSDLTAGESYTVVVNGDVTETFVGN